MIVRKIRGLKVGQVVLSERVSWHMAAAGIYLVSVSLCIRIPVYLAWNAIRSETVVPASH